MSSHVNKSHVPNERVHKFCALLNHRFSLIYCNIDCDIITVTFRGAQTKLRLINHTRTTQYASVELTFLKIGRAGLCAWEPLHHF